MSAISLFALGSGLQFGDGSASCETGVGFMPMVDGLFAVFPAEQHFASLVGRGEVDEPHSWVLELAADGFEFADQALELLHQGGGLDLNGLGLYGLAGSGQFRTPILQVGQTFEGLDDVLGDPADQRQRPTRFFEAEDASLRLFS